MIEAVRHFRQHQPYHTLGLAIAANTITLRDLPSALWELQLCQIYGSCQEIEAMSKINAVALSLITTLIIYMKTSDERQFFSSTLRAVQQATSACIGSLTDCALVIINLIAVKCVVFGAKKLTGYPVAISQKGALQLVAIGVSTIVLTALPNRRPDQTKVSDYVYDFLKLISR